MTRLRRVMQVWNWLPAFRAVGETEHLTRAAHEIHVTPPAVSRTVRLLEEDLGVQLFDRRGGRLTLNAAGRILLGAVRNAMRLVHDAVVEIDEPVPCDLQIASIGVFTIVALEDTLVRLGKSHPEVTPRVRTSRGDDPARDLLQGVLDVYLTDEPVFGDGLTTTLLGETGSSIFCGVGHPLIGRTEVTLEDLATHPFVAPGHDPNGLPLDGWPAGWPRTVRVEVDRQAVGLAFCLGGRFLALLPDPIGYSNPSLWRLPVSVPGVTRVYAVYRTILGHSGAVGALVEHAKASLRDEPLMEQAWGETRDAVVGGGFSSVRSARRQTAAATSARENEGEQAAGDVVPR